MYLSLFFLQFDFLKIWKEHHFFPHLFVFYCCCFLTEFLNIIDSKTKSCTIPQLKNDKNISALHKWLHRYRLKTNNTLFFFPWLIAEIWKYFLHWFFLICDYILLLFVYICYHIPKNRLNSNFFRDWLLKYRIFLQLVFWTT